jgi:POT family proton-dependent oligopeptide transporter
MSEATNSADRHVIPEFKQVMGHPSPLWMLFMSEFWERFAFYGIRWALVLYIVAQFHGGNQSGQADANLTYGSYLALVYAGAIFGGYIADKIIGYQRSILIGAVFMAAGLFMITIPVPVLFKFGLATIIRFFTWASTWVHLSHRSLPAGLRPRCLAPTPHLRTSTCSARPESAC